MNASDKFGETSLSGCYGPGAKEMASLMIEHGAKLDVPSMDWSYLGRFNSGRLRDGEVHTGARRGSELQGQEGANSARVPESPGTSWGQGR